MAGHPTPGERQTQRGRVPIGRIIDARARVDLYLVHDGSRLRAEVHEPRRPGRLIWRGETALVRGRGGRLSASLSWQGQRIRVRLVEGSEDAIVSLHTRLPRPLPAPPPPSAPEPLRRATLDRAPRNPILMPCAERSWESQAVFNAAAIELEGRIHLLYCAVGEDGQSVLGHAVSANGLEIDERGCDPAYSTVSDTAEAGPLGTTTAAVGYHSGAPGPGCEDPRLCLLEDRLYLTYTAYDGRQPPQMALTSIAVGDFLARRWHWQPPRMLSAAGQAHKNWVLFPQRIGGRVALLHGIAPQPRIALVEDWPPREGRIIASGYCNTGDPSDWDNQPRGAAAPPLPTAAGWLLLYHGMDRRDPGRYKLGAMLLDREDPRRVLARLPYPLLEPDARYENEGHKRGVVYCCGAVPRGDRLLIYYGGADTVLCVASVELPLLLAELRRAGATPRRSHDLPAA